LNRISEANASNCIVIERVILITIRYGKRTSLLPLINCEKETPCRIELSFPLLQPQSLASRVFRPMPWRIGAAPVRAVFASEAITAAPITEVMRAAVWVSALASAPLPWAQQS
jgi:hypothetical protein